MKKLVVATMLILISVTMIAAAGRIEVVGEKEYNNALLCMQISDAIGVSPSYAQILINNYGTERAKTLLKYKYTGSFRPFLWGHEYKVWTFGACMYLVIYDPLTEREVTSNASIALFESSNLKRPVLSDHLPYMETEGYYMYLIDVSPGDYDVLVRINDEREVSFKITVRASF